MMPVIGAELRLTYPHRWLLRFELNDAEHIWPLSDEAEQHLEALLPLVDELQIIGAAQSNEGKRVSVLRVEVHYRRAPEIQRVHLSLGRTDTEIPPPGSTRCPHCEGHGRRSVVLPVEVAALYAEEQADTEAPMPTPSVACWLCRAEGHVLEVEARRYGNGHTDFGERIRELERQSAVHTAAKLREEQS
jgi:hypothetical protein